MINYEQAKKDGYDISDDGCTWSPDLNFGEECCKEHDFYYENHVEQCFKTIETYPSYYYLRITRKEADIRLRECIKSQRVYGLWRYKLLPWIYYGAVRLIGGLYWPKKKTLGKGLGNKLSTVEKVLGVEKKRKQFNYTLEEEER